MLLGTSNQEIKLVGIDDLVVVAEFRDSIYPGLVSTGKVERGRDKPFHTVINGENYHVLKTLTYTHKGKVEPSISIHLITLERGTGSTITTM